MHSCGDVHHFIYQLSATEGLVNIVISNYLSIDYTAVLSKWVIEMSSRSCYISRYEEQKFEMFYF